MHIETQFSNAPVYYAGRDVNGTALFSIHDGGAHRFDSRADAEDVEQDILVNVQGVTGIRICED